MDSVPLRLHDIREFSYLKATMALQELCGLDNAVKNNFLKNDLDVDSEVLNYSRNFSNNFELAVPPFSNVSTFYCH